MADHRAAWTLTRTGVYPTRIEWHGENTPTEALDCGVVLTDYETVRNISVSKWYSSGECKMTMRVNDEH